MKCPACRNTELRHRLLKNGLDVDTCPACRGVWLDRGELFRLAAHKQTARLYVEKLGWDSTETERDCPHCGIHLFQGRFEEHTADLDYCGQCEGIWFDAVELKRTAAFLAEAFPDPSEDGNLKVWDSGRRKRPPEPAKPPAGFLYWACHSLADFFSPRYRLLSRAVPLSEATNVSEGLVIIEGRVRLGDHALLSPFTHTPCGCYRLLTSAQVSQWVLTRRTFHRHDPKTWQKRTHITGLDHKWHYGSCTLANNATTTEVEIQFEGTELIATPTRDRRRSTYVGGYEMLIETEEVFAREGDELFAIAEVPHHGDVQLLLDTAVQPIFILDRDPAEISAEYRSRAATAMLAVGIFCGLSLIVILAILLI